MGSLFGSLYISTGSLLAQQTAIGVTANNVSNINTPGYTRQRADLAESPAYFNGTQSIGTGVQVQQIVSLRDRVLELRIQSEMQQQGSLQAQVNSLSDVNTQFSTQNTNLGQAIDSFFDSLSNLSSNPSDSSLRQSVLVSGQSLASQFQTTSNLLTQQQFNLNLQIQQGVSQVNEITTQLASLNQQISTSGVPEDQLGTLVDQRDNLLENLSSLLGNNVITADNGVTVTASDGTALVVGNQSYTVNYSVAANGQPQVTVGGHDIGDPTAGGSINGLLQVRNQAIPSVLSGLDSLASNLANSFNAVHESGYDLNGNTGVDFFTPPPAGGTGAASAFSVAITDPSQIAASSDGAAGDNGNLNALLNLRNQPIINGDSPTDAYSKLTFEVGSDLSNAQDSLSNSETSVQQLTDQRGAISGVSLDEEASNLIQYQRAYESAARVLGVVSQLTEDAVNLGNISAVL
jgi:flagellar hook-associated protein 1 FlgK